MPRRTAWTESQDQRAYELRHLGVGWGAIAEALGMSGESVARAAANRYRERLGIVAEVSARRSAAGRLAAEIRHGRADEIRRGLVDPTTPTVEGRATLVAQTILPLAQRTFGAEVEFTGKYKHQAAHDIAHALHAAGYAVAQYQGEPHIHSMPYHGERCEVCGEHVRDKYLQWRIERDGSVTTYRHHIETDPNNGGQEFGGEVVSPILTTADFPQLAIVLKALRQQTTWQNAGAHSAKVNANCGLHIHVGVKDLTPAQRAAIYRHWYSATSIVSTFVAQSRNNNYFCRVPAQHEIDRVARTLEMNIGATLQNVTEKYRSLNVLPFPKIGTFEFRLHQGTLNAQKIQQWVTLLLAFVTGFATEDATPVGQIAERTDRFLDILVAKTQAPTKLKTYFVHRQGVLVPHLRRQTVNAPQTTQQPEEVNA